MNQNWKISRRTMLRGTGAALALPLLDVMKNEALFGKETVAPPMRMISLFMPNGVNPATWDVQGEGADYQISESLEPLSGLRKHVSILSNLDNTGAGGQQGGRGRACGGRGAMRAGLQLPRGEGLRPAWQHTPAWHTWASAAG